MWGVLSMCGTTGGLQYDFTALENTRGSLLGWHVKTPHIQESRAPSQLHSELGKAGARKGMQKLRLMCTQH